MLACVCDLPLATADLEAGQRMNEMTILPRVKHQTLLDLDKMKSKSHLLVSGLGHVDRRAISGLIELARVLARPGRESILSKLPNLRRKWIPFPISP